MSPALPQISERLSVTMNEDNENEDEVKTKWAINLTGIKEGIFKPHHGVANEFIAIGRTIKAGFPTLKSEITNSRYDAIVDLGSKKTLLRMQIKGSTTGGFGFIGGYRSGKQVSREAPARDYKYSKDDIDILLGIDSNNGDCYIIPIEDIQEWGKSRSMSKLQYYKENWQILIDIAKNLK